MKKQVKRKKGIQISGEMTMILMLNAFVIGILVEKIILNGFSWISTTGLLGYKGVEICF